MQPDWEQGSNAHSLPSEQRANPYQPVDYARRLQRVGARRPTSQAQGRVPGQQYDEPVSMPPPQPMPPVQPAYFPLGQRMPTAFDAAPPPQLTPGMPYGARASQPTQQQPEAAPRPEAAPFQWQPSPARTPMWQPEPQWNESLWEEPEQELPMPPAPEPIYRDAFTPAKPREETDPPREAPVPARRAGMTPGRIAAAVLAVAMLAFCAVVGGRMVLDLTRNEREMEEARTAFYQSNGVELQNGGSRVELLPAGQTFVPTAAPTPTLYVAGPTPEPRIAMNEAAIADLNGREPVDAPLEAEATFTPNPRTRLATYPKNPLYNVQESLRGLIEENKDVIGRLVIDGVLDEVVLQRGGVYYLTHSATGANSKAGAVFADDSCSLRMPPENLLLRGQSTVPGQVFEPLWQFISGGAAFAANASTATLTTLYEEERYFLFAVLVAGSDPRENNYFNYASQPTFTTDERMLAYVQSLKARSLYPFATDVQPSDRLLTLATLGGENSLVLVYRMAREGE